MSFSFALNLWLCSTSKNKLCFPSKKMLSVKIASINSLLPASFYKYKHVSTPLQSVHFIHTVIDTVLRILWIVFISVCDARMGSTCWEDNCPAFASLNNAFTCERFNPPNTENANPSWFFCRRKFCEQINEYELIYLLFLCFSLFSAISKSCMYIIHGTK